MTDTSERDAAQAPWQRLFELEQRIYDAVPPIDPPGCHWLNEDAGTSYCWGCARKAAWLRMGKTGDPPAEPDWSRRTKTEERIRDRIDGPASGESDSGEACATCGRTLSHLLTETGVAQELDHFAENPIEDGDTIGGEQSYELSRIFLNLTWQGAKPDDVAAAIVIAESALSAIAAQSPPAKIA